MGDALNLTNATVSDQVGAFAATFVALADTLVRDFDPVEFLHLLTRRCVSLLDIDRAGLLLVGPDGKLRLMSASHETTPRAQVVVATHRLDERQR